MKKALEFVHTILTRIRERVKRFLFDTDTDPAEVMSALALWWCTYVLVVDPSYILTSERLAPILSIWPVSVWAMVMGACALYQTVVFLLGGPPHLISSTPTSCRCCLRARLIGHLACLFVQTVIAVLTHLKGVTIVGGLVGVFAAGNAWGAWQTYTLLSADSVARWMRVTRMLTKRLSESSEAIDKLEGIGRCG